MHTRKEWGAAVRLLGCLLGCLLFGGLSFTAAAQAQVTGSAPAAATQQRTTQDSAATPQPDAWAATRQLTDRDPRVRQEGAETLARLAAVAQRRLVEGYRAQEGNTRVRLALDWALYRMGNAPALFAVVRALDTKQSAQAAGYLTELETPEPLYALLPRVNGRTQARLLGVLGRVGNEATITQIKPYADSFDPQVAAAAQQAGQEITRRLNGPPAAAAPSRPRQVEAQKPPLR